MKLLAAKLMRADESLLRQHYADLSAKKFFSDLVAYMASGPVLPMVWQGLNAVKQGRAMLGATNPKVWFVAEKAFLTFTRLFFFAISHS